MFTKTGRFLFFLSPASEVPVRKNSKQTFPKAEKVTAQKTRDRILYSYF